MKLLFSFINEPTLNTIPGEVEVMLCECRAGGGRVFIIVCRFDLCHMVLF